MSPRALLGLVFEGLSTNLWGLGCPFYCVQPSFGLVSLFFLLGWICGLVTCGLGLWWLICVGVVPWTSPVDLSGPPVLPSRARVLSSYLHEQGFIHRERHR